MGMNSKTVMIRSAKGKAMDFLERYRSETKSNDVYLTSVEIENISNMFSLMRKEFDADGLKSVLDKLCTDVDLYPDMKQDVADIIMDEAVYTGTVKFLKQYKVVFSSEVWEGGYEYFDDLTEAFSFINKELDEGSGYTAEIIDRATNSRTTIVKN